MSFKPKLINPAQELFLENCNLLYQGSEILTTLTPADYVAIDARSLGGSIGGHIRHCVEFYRVFLRGLETGNLDYDARPRDAAIENDPAEARLAIAITRHSLAKVAEFYDPETPLQILENHSGGASSWSASSVSRELRFLLSHTIHHFALIAILLRLKGLEIPVNFGVAPSTIQHHRNLKPHSSSCAQ